MPLKPKKIPMRMCVACREMRPKAELLRVVKPQDGQAHIDFKGKAPGRGAYICPSLECFERARKTRALERALEAAIPPEVFDALEEQLERGE
ncbi:MAG TPA: YlxR family protein [Candidatus Pullichristensenella stercorigallinarum]|uniref:YlxR family protein n=1 Tax=Candidatus Pullichristensenella stercorigallinarum TaxID=2840909 RepID=A0A9D0ZM99_9FIRM|nr:YlxR family protein [Candidatus Pullichristensenella stercorigallinarum]